MQCFVVLGVLGAFGACFGQGYVGKQCWKFKIEGGKLSLQPSFFVDAQGNSRKTNQLVFETKSISQYVTMRWHISLQ